MASNDGAWHKTSLQAARERSQTYSTTSVAGQKRTRSEFSHLTSSRPLVRGHSLYFQRSSSAPAGPPRLTASSIVSLVSSSAQGPTEYSQRKGISATPSATVDPLLSLSHTVYDLPPPLVQNFHNLGIKSIYPWQKSCLLGPGLLAGEKNLVYSAPTGGGKSLVADVLMLKRVLHDQDAKALLVLPYVALVQEKVRWLRNIAQGLTKASNRAARDENDGLWMKRADEGTVRVVGFFGGSKVKATWLDFDIGVCTMEKANQLVNTAIDDCSITKLKVVVLDELHMIDDDGRGYLMELMATKLLTLGQSIQIIGMSATLSNIKLLATWLDAHAYETRYKPVPIEEHLVYEGSIYLAAAATKTDLLTTASQSTRGAISAQGSAKAVRFIHSSSHKEFQDPVLNAVVALANETARAGYGVLVFASSRLGCESDARLISRVMPRLHELDPGLIEERGDLLAGLRSLGTGLDPVLEETVPFGVAFHHAGLTTEERDLIANAYDSGVIRVCIATCSLAAGINLPARRVILHGAKMGRDLVGPSMLRQMRGRAGRKGKDEVGETYLCCRKEDLEEVVELMHAQLPHISSCLNSDRQRIQRALLEVIAIRLATSRAAIEDYVTKSLLFHSGTPESLQDCVESSLNNLQKMGFVQMDEISNYRPTQLGKAIVASALDPDDGVFIHKELARALQAFVMDGELHVLYTFTPVQDSKKDSSPNVNWQVFRNEMEALDESGLRVLGFLGLKPATIVKLAQGSTLKESTPEERDIARVYRRFYLALQLRDLCNEVPILTVARKYDVPRGAVQTLSHNCHGFAAGMIKFCQHMGWGAMSAALDHFTDRLKAGARSDLLALAQITFVKSRTARIFWDTGFRSVAAVANADPKELLPILMQAQPSKVRVKGMESDDKYEEKLLAKATIICNSANRLWQVQMQQDLDEE